MRFFELLDRGDVPGTDSVMELYQRGDELAIRVDGRELMSNRMHGSEDALAHLATERLRKRPGVRILIGGLGMGFTLAAALETSGEDAEVVVAELVPAIVRWNRGPIGPAAGHPLKDPRASVFAGDVADAIRGGPGRWDAILLDVDNGPNGLTRATNDWLYSWEGLHTAREALRPGGLLCVWSAADHPVFTRRMRKARFNVEVVPVRSRGKKGGRRHVVWVGTR